MIIKAKHNFFIYNFFRNYAVRKTNRCFEAVNIIGEYEKKEKPLLIVANHISWWDGFWIMYLNRTFFKKKFHFMMLEEQLKKYRFFNYSGGFSVNKKSKTIIETLQYTTDLLKDKKNMVLIFPQGEIKSIYETNIKFEKGLDWIIKKTDNIQIIQVANFVDYFSKPKPSLYIYFEEFNPEKNTKLEQSYNQFYSNCIEKQKLKPF